MIQNPMNNMGPIPQATMPQNQNFNYQPTAQYPNNLHNLAPQGAQTPFYSQSVLSPAGMVFIINSTQDLNTIPLAAGLNLYWCTPENKVIVRNYINNTLETKEYFISTNQNENNNGSQFGAGAIAGEDVDIPTEFFNKFDTRLSSIETQIEKLIKSTKGGSPEWQL